MVRGGRAEAPLPRSDVSFRLDQKTGNSKAAIVSRQNQWGVITEGKRKNELANKTEFRFIKKTIIIIRGRQLLYVLRMNAGGIRGQMVLNTRKAATLHCSKDVAFACNEGGGSLTSCVSDVRRGG